jgi:hypothetical protein
MKFRSISALVLLFAFSGSAEAKIFSNQFVEFQLPEKWECQLDGTEWVCQSTDEQKKRDAIIVLAAKIRKPGMDELTEYRAHLKKKQLYQSLSGETVESEPKYVKDTVVSGTTWVDSLHLQSEIPDFYTRYLATVVQDLGVLVTFSVRKDKYNEYAPDIEALVKSLKAFRKPGDPNAQSGETTGEAQNPDDLVFDKNAEKKNKNEGAHGNNEDAATALLVVIVAVAAGGYIIWRRRKK